MDSEARKNLAISLCKQHQCTEKLAKIHFDQFVKRGWHPHPPPDFITWWKHHPESNTMNAVKAFNCRLYVDEFNATTLIP